MNNIRSLRYSSHFCRPVDTVHTLTHVAGVCHVSSGAIIHCHHLCCVYHRCVLPGPVPFMCSYWVQYGVTVHASSYRWWNEHLNGIKHLVRSAYSSSVHTGHPRQHMLCIAISGNMMWTWSLVVLLLPQILSSLLSDDTLFY